MSYFPIILIPEQIKLTNSAQPPVPAPPKQPEQPKPKPQKVNITLIGIETAITVVIVPVLSQITSISGWILLFVALIAITGHTWYQVKTYPQRKQNHEREVQDYFEQLKNYQRKIIEYEEEVKAARSPERLAEFRYKLLLEVLSQTTPHDGNSSIATRNPEEANFKIHLNKYFFGNIYTGLTLKIPGFEHPYTPDFAYIDQRLKLYIDIELDEPYVYHTGVPTHYLGASKDSKRNNFFKNKGWVVIRFSEEQVICYPHSCCKAVAQVIAQITGDTSTLNQFANIADLQQQRQWTRDESLEMAANRKRDNYQCQNNGFSNNSSESMASQLESTQLYFKPNLTRAQRRGATRAKYRHQNLSISSPSNNTTSHPLSLLPNCPYCGAKVKSTKLESHKKSKCPKRPNL